MWSHVSMRSVDARWSHHQARRRRYLAGDHLYCSHPRRIRTFGTCASQLEKHHLPNWFLGEPHFDLAWPLHQKRCRLRSTIPLCKTVDKTLDPYSSPLHWWLRDQTGTIHGRNTRSSHYLNRCQQRSRFILSHGVIWSDQLESHHPKFQVSA